MDVSETYIDGLSVREWGNPDGPEIVFVHGIMQSQDAFVRQRIRSLASQFRMVSYDLRGHGQSAKPYARDLYAGASHASDLEHILVAKALERPVLVGWSIGARLVAEHARLFGGSRAKGVVLTGVRAVHADDASTRGPASALIAAMAGPDADARDRALDAFLRVQVFEALGDHDYTFMHAYNTQCPLHVRLACLDWTRGYSPDYGAITARRIIIQGLEDRVASPGRIPDFASTIGAELHFYEGVGHMPFWEAPDRFNADLSRFVNEVNQHE